MLTLIAWIVAHGIQIATVGGAFAAISSAETVVLDTTAIVREVETKKQ